MSKVVINVLEEDLKSNAPHWMSEKRGPLTEEQKKEIRDRNRAKWLAEQRAKRKGSK